MAFYIRTVFTVLVIVTCFYPAEMIEESFCAGIGYNDEARTMLGLRSMGHYLQYSHPLNTIWGANHGTSPLTHTDGVIIRAYLVDQNFVAETPGQLYGWLKLSIRKRSGKFTALAVWALTDSNESVGEFFSLPVVSDSCKGWEKTENFLPCSAAPIDATRVPNMFIYTNPNQLDPKLSQIDLLWKLNFNYCNKPTKFRFMVATNSKGWQVYSKVKPFPVVEGSTNGLGPLIYTTEWFEPKYYGAAAPYHDLSALICHSEVGGSQKHVWLRKIPPRNQSTGITVVPEGLWYEDRWKVSGTGSVSEDTDVVGKRATCKAQASGFVSFGGRCTAKVNSGQRVYATLQTLPICQPTPGALDADETKLFKIGYRDYIISRERELEGNCNCPDPPTAEMVKAAQSGHVRKSVGPTSSVAGLRSSFM